MAATRISPICQKQQHLNLCKCIKGNVTTLSLLQQQQKEKSLSQPESLQHSNNHMPMHLEGNKSNSNAAATEKQQ